MPRHARMEPPDGRDPSSPNAQRVMLAEGLGDFAEGAGWPFVTRVPPGMTSTAPSASPRLLTRFVHVADIQLADDESPARFSALDAPGPLNAALRPHDFAMCRVLSSAVATVRAVHEESPLDFVLLGGDNIDSAQHNELEWLKAILDGGPADCDSGADDDLATGDDAKDPFTSPGLPVPWKWVTGNHDVCVQGVLPINAENSATAIGDSSPQGTRDWSKPGGPVVTGGPLVPDPRRRLLPRAELMAEVGEGHGAGAGVRASGKAFYTFDVAATRVRFVVLDTAAETGGSGGVLHRADADALLRPLLDAALREEKWVILTSHHSIGSIGDGSDYGGTRQADAMSREAIRELLAGYPNVILWIAGHSHEHRVTWQGAWWEVVTAALGDHPQQMRLVELWDEGQGRLRLHATALDYASYGDPVVEQARRLATLDYVSGWWSGGSGRPEDRNVDLWISAPR